MHFSSCQQTQHCHCTFRSCHFTSENNRNCRTVPSSCAGNRAMPDSQSLSGAAVQRMLPFSTESCDMVASALRNSCQSISCQLQKVHLWRQLKEKSVPCQRVCEHNGRFHPSVSNHKAEKNIGDIHISETTSDTSALNCPCSCKRSIFSNNISFENEFKPPAHCAQQLFSQISNKVECCSVVNDQEAHCLSVVNASHENSSPQTSRPFQQANNCFPCIGRNLPRKGLKLFEYQVAICGWYYGKLSWQEAEVKLRDSEVGTFLLRDSSDPRYRFSMSVQTHRGPTSVRIIGNSTEFCLDSDPGSHSLAFQSVHDLIQHYVRLSRPARRAPVNPYTRSAVLTGGHVWMDSTGSVVASIQLSKPLMHTVLSLKHLARLAVNKHEEEIEFDSLPVALQHYLHEYPYCC
ncbi:uncharacterized protein LOC108673507 [Hyalella azteca]|uniref:Uncharacterized protein LOC108673507 n=2 Tax=Hyalella azteca TaxID=294128 RepID=A0A979FGW0_HYAAZ|nr:uncharacterized protein LOC108673507 [Hyalella azteca]